jgi:hypothetical protein
MTLSNIYDSSKLTRAKQRLETRVREIIVKGLQPKFTAEEKRKLNRVHLEFPLIGYHQNPLDYYADYANQIIFLPIVSLQFFEDLCTAYAWLWANKYSLDTIDEYIAMLKYKPAKDFAGHRYPLPLEALQIPDSALTDHSIDELSLRFRNSAYAFILAHELGHIYHGDYGYVNLTPEQAQSIEEEADLFALKIMQRASTIPMGAMLWFQATAYYFPNRGDYGSDEDWKDFLKTEATHPLNSQRLRTLAARLYEHAGDFARYESDKTAGNERVEFIARGILMIARVLEDTDLQRFIATKARSANLSSLAPRR